MAKSNFLSSKSILAVGFVLASILAVAGLVTYFRPVLNIAQLRSSFSNSEVKPEVTYNSQTTTSKVTNQWFSSLYFHEWSEPLFAYPLSFKLTADNFQINYPKVVGSPKTVFASHQPQLLISPQQGKWARKEVISADTTSVAFKLCAQEGCVSTRIAHGLPSTVLTAESPINLSIKGTISAIQPVENSYLVTTDHGQYLVIPFDATTQFITQSDQQLNIALPANQKIIIALQPDTAVLTPNDWRSEVIGVEYGFQTADQELSAGLKYQTLGDQTPLVATIPQWQSRTPDSNMGTYTSLRGIMQLHRTSEFVQELSAPKIVPVSEMVGKLSQEERTTLNAKVKQDTAKLSTENIAEGVYFGGKDIFKRAQLYEIARALGDIESSNNLENQIIAGLSQKLTVNGYLKVQEDPKGVMAQKPEFGHEFFSDHHFHYAYYVATLGILLESRPDLLPNYQAATELLLNDIANTNLENGFPWVRGFDPYEGHSWADGRALAGDGNNQESTSEAVNRWYGLLRLAQTTQNQELLSLARVGLATESQSARLYWLGMEPEKFSFASGYEYPVASLVWGGKVDYATWFSGQPTHIFGIQFLPSTPALTYAQNREVWQRYTTWYQNTSTEDGWNDIRAMIAVMNGEQVPKELPRYEGGNTQSWYYMWVSYWSKL